MPGADLLATNANLLFKLLDLLVTVFLLLLQLTAHHVAFHELNGSNQGLRDAEVGILLYSKSIQGCTTEKLGRLCKILLPTCDREELITQRGWQKDLNPCYLHKTWLFYEYLETKAFLGTRIHTKDKGQPVKRVCNAIALGSSHMALGSPNMLQVYVG